MKISPHGGGKVACEPVRPEGHIVQPSVGVCKDGQERAEDSGAEQKREKSIGGFH